MTNGSARLEPLDDAEWPEEIRHLLAGFAGRLNVYRVMAHNPALLAAWEALRNHVVLNSALTPQQSEIVILRVGVRRRSDYEWAHHVLRGLQAGLDQARILATREPACEPLKGDDAVLIAVVDELVDDGRLPADLLERCTARVGAAGVLDIMATIGMYFTLSCILKTFAVPQEEEVSRAMDEIGWA